jgi:hypothetical protein
MQSDKRQRDIWSTLTWILLKWLVEWSITLSCHSVMQLICVLQLPVRMTYGTTVRMVLYIRHSYIWEVKYWLRIRQLSCVPFRQVSISWLIGLSNYVGNSDFNGLVGITKNTSDFTCGEVGGEGGEETKASGVISGDRKRLITLKFEMFRNRGLINFLCTFVQQNALQCTV